MTYRSELDITNSEPYKEINSFLRLINLEEYTLNFIKNGFDDLNIIINQIKTVNAMNDIILKDIGISVPGYRAKILIKLEESKKFFFFQFFNFSKFFLEAQLFTFDVPPVAYYSIGDLKKIKSSHILNDTNIKGIFTWLGALKIEKYTKNFILNGYHSMELMLIQMASR